MEGLGKGPGRRDSSASTRGGGRGGGGEGVREKAEGELHHPDSEVILFCRVCEALWGPEQMKSAI